MSLVLSRMRMLYLALVLACLAAPLATQAQVMTVETTGQARATGAAADAHLERRALQEALYQAALKGGAAVSGYTAVSQAVIQSDVLVVRPDARVLDYDILSRETTSEASTVKIRAVVGQLNTATACARRADLTIALERPVIKASHLAPPWVPQIAPDLHRALRAQLEGMAGITVVDAAPAFNGMRSNVPDEFNYRSLTTGVSGLAPAGTGTPALPLQSQVTLDATTLDQNAALLPVKVELFLGSGLAGQAPLRASKTEMLTVKRRHKVAQFANPIGDVRSNVSDALEQALGDMAQDLTAQRACQPLRAALTLTDGQLRLPFGHKDGLGTHHLAYTQGRDTAYDVLEIVELAAHSVTLRPLDSTTRPGALAGKTVQFIELSK